MNPELVLKFMSQNAPWAFGLRYAIQEKSYLIQEAALHEAPFFAAVGPVGNQLKVVGDDLEDCMEQCLSRSPYIQPVPDSSPIGFVSIPE